MSPQDRIQGHRVRIVDTSNRFARDAIGKTGIVIGHAPLSMVVVKLDDGTADDYWAHTCNLAYTHADTESRP